MNVIFAMPGKFLQRPSHHHLIIFISASVIRSGSTCLITLAVYLATSQHYRIKSNSCYFPGPKAEVRVTKLFFSIIFSTSPAPPRKRLVVKMCRLPPCWHCPRELLLWILPSSIDGHCAQLILYEWSRIRMMLGTKSTHRFLRKPTEVPWQQHSTAFTELATQSESGGSEEGISIYSMIRGTRLLFSYLAILSR